MSLHVTEVRPPCAGDPPPVGVVELDSQDRWLRRRPLTANDGVRLMVDMSDARVLPDGERLVAEDGRHWEVRAAPEPLLSVAAPDLARIAWHVGNRHAPCQIGPDRILVRDDPVMRRMLEGLGASVAPVVAPFEPEGGAYGHGRTHGHSHGHGDGHDRDDHG